MESTNNYRVHLEGRYIEGIEGRRIIGGEQDALDLMAAGYGDDINRSLLFDSNLHPDFFDLKTGFAGRIMQKFVTYRFRVAFVVDQAKLRGRFAEFAREADKGNHFRFFSGQLEALDWLIP